jgi:hypothetical protein
VTLARQNQERGHQAWALHLLGAVHTRAGPSARAEAEDVYRTALALAGELGMRPLVAHCEFGLGDLVRSMDRPAHAQEHLAMAASLFREMDMRGGPARGDTGMWGLG